LKLRMAEYVEQRMEEMIPEVEELERVGILSTSETKELIKKRKHFEYKIQKRTKQKEDFFAYIQYESNLLKLIEIRREEIGYQHKKGHIENAIKNRINKLYKILCHRWQSDTKIWLSHIDWLKQARWRGSVSKVFLRMLQVHNNNPKLWVAAAKYEFEAGSADTGRQIMLRGIRFHPTSKLLHREYVKFELLFVEKLRARKKLLQLKTDEEEVKEKKEEKAIKSADESEEEGEDEDSEVKIKRSDRGGEDEISDSILNCDLVNLVVESALESVPEPEFAVSLLVTIRQFPFAKVVEESVLNTVNSKWADHPVTIDTRARMELEKGGSMKARIAACVSVYTSALEGAESPDPALFHLAFSTLKDLPSLAPACTPLILGKMLNLLQFGGQHGLLDIQEYEFQLKLINTEGNRKESLAVAHNAVKTYPEHLEFWLLQLSLELEPGSTEYRKTLAAATVALKDKQEALWSGFLQLMNKAGRGDEAFDELSACSDLERNGELRVLLLERTRDKGIEPARQMYTKYASLPPYSEQFYRTMLETELEQPKVSKNRVREIYRTLSNQLGSSNIQAWLDWIHWEETSGSVLEVGQIVCRAEAALSSDLKNKFTTLRQLSSQ